jgi:hypothetical protein
MARAIESGASNVDFRVRVVLTATWFWLFLCSGPVAAEGTYVVSWNAYSLQFIDPPVFELLPLLSAKTFRATIEQGGETWQVESQEPRLDLAPVWDQMAVRKFKLTFVWLDADGKVVRRESRWRTKAPDWQGFHEPPVDWAAAADRTIAYLIRVADEGPAPYREEGVPVWIWSAASAHPSASREVLGPGYELEWYRNAFQYRVDRWPDGHDEGYPGCIVPAIIYGMTAHAHAGGEQAEAAMRLARAAADWALQHRLPDDRALPLFPYSTISRGKFYGGIESKNVNLLRASWIGLSFVHLYEATHEQKYLDYARHIAEVTARFQSGDGSFPYRLNPATGDVTEKFCTGAIQFSLLVEALQPYGVDPMLQLASERAIQWMIAYPAQTNHWQGGYEDIGERRPYENLTHWEAQLLIQYLCRHTDRDPAYRPLARRLNRFVEDQFVLFGPESEAHAVPIKGPLVFEQFACWFPMEVHAGYWIQTLIALHRATGDDEYLQKAMATGNAICAQQFDDGSISNWGTRWVEDGEVHGKNCGHNWYNCNALAAAALYQLTEYQQEWLRNRRRESSIPVPTSGASR